MCDATERLPPTRRVDDVVRLGNVRFRFIRASVLVAERCRHHIQLLYALAEISDWEAPFGWRRHDRAGAVLMTTVHLITLVWKCRKTGLCGRTVLGRTWMRSPREGPERSVDFSTDGKPNVL